VSGGSFVTPGTRDRVRGLAIPIATALGRLGFTPNALTLIGFLGTCIAAVAAASQAWLLAGILVLVFGVFDLFDGTLARATGKASRLGAFLDSVFDRAGEAIVYVGVAVGSLQAGFEHGPSLAAAAMAASFMVSYVRAKSEGLGFTAGSGMANIGLAPREVRIVILAVALVLAVPLGTGPLQLGLAVIAVLATITIIQRIVHVVNQGSEQEKS
jgi:phosphatidylglycerophosphate synthase